MLFLALSCLQGRPALGASQELLDLAPDGLQLTPGNVPDPGFSEALRAIPLRTHHGFSWSAMKQTVWGSNGACLVQSDSVHPPRASHPAYADWWATVEREAGTRTFETMYPGYRLGTGSELERAMDLRLPLAVDIAHLFIQHVDEVIAARTWKRLQSYESVVEVHVSANNGRSDSHRPLSSGTFGLAWARERDRAGTLVVLECYMHKLSETARHAQVALARGCS